MKTLPSITTAPLRRKSARILAGSIAVLISAGSLAQAANQTWDGGGADANWFTLLNWVGDTAAPGATSGTTNTDVAFFNAAIANTWGNAVGNPIVIDSATHNLGGISFGAAAGNYFIGSTGGNSLLLTSGGAIQMLSTLTATNAIENINAPLAIQGASGTYTFANNSSNGAGAGAGTLNFGGGITGGAAGATVLNLSGANTNANTISGIIADGSATSLAVTKSGSGAWKLTGANTYTGTTAINAGTLTLNRQTGSLNSASALTFTGSGTFNMDNVGAGGALTQSLGALTFSSGDGTVKTTRTVAFDQAITFASLSARTAGASANFVNTGTNSATNGFIFTAAPTVGQIIDRGYFYNGSSYAAYDAGGFIRAYTTGDANYLSVAGGATMGAASTDNVALTGSITAQTTTTVNTINMGANNLTMSAAGQILSTNGLLSSGSTTATLGFAGTTAGTTGVLQAVVAGDEIVIRVNGSADKLTLNAIIQNVAAGATASSLTKTGAGTLVLNDNSNNNTYTGNTFLNAGTVQLGSANAGNGARNWFGTGTLTIADGASITTNSDPAKTVSNNVFLSGGYANLASRDIFFTGQISGPGGVAVIPFGRWVNLNNATNNFTGGIVMRGNGTNNTLRIFTTGSLSTGGIRVEGTNNFFATDGFKNLSIGAGIANAIELASGGSLEISSNSGPILLSGAITGGGSLSHFNSGTLTLSGVNSYTGGTTVKAGVLTVSGSGTFGGSTGNLTAQGGTLNLAGNSFSAGTVNITGGIIQSGTLTGTSYAGTSGFVSANLAGSGALTKTGGGRLVLSGTNTYIGSTTISDGTLRAISDISLPNYTTGTINVGATGTLQVTTGEWNNTEIAGLLANPNLLFTSGGTFAIDTTNGDFSNSTTIDIVNLGLTKLGANTLTLTGTNSYTKTTTVNRGTLKIDAGAGSVLSSLSPLTFSGTGKFDYDNTTAAGATAQSLAALTFSAGEGTVQVTRTAAQTVGLTFSSLAARTAGATRNFVLAGTPGVNGTDSKIVFTAGATANAFIDHGSYFGGSAYAWNDAGNFVRAIDYATDAGATTSGTTATLASATHQQITGAITAQNTATFTTLNISGNNSLTLAAAQTVTLNGVLKSGNTAGGATISGGTGINTVANGELVVRTDGASDAVTISTPILGNGTSSLTKSGAGTLTLSGPNTITGISNVIVNGVTLNAGTLNINHATALGGPMTAGGGNSNARFTINDGTTIDNTSGAALTMTLKYPMTWNGSFTFTGSNDLNFFDTSGNGNLTMPNDLTITVAAKTLNIPHNFQGTSASLTKNGPGTLALGTNGGAGYSGGLIINNGVLTSVSGQPDGIAGTGPVTLGSATASSDNAILSSGSNTTHSNPITVRAGTTGIIALTAYANTGTWAGPVILNNNLTVGGAGAVTLTSVISGSGNLNIGNAGTYITGTTTRALTNTGTVTLIGINTFTGDTVMVSNSGTLSLGGLSALKNSTLDTGTSGGQQVTFSVGGNNTYNIGGLKGADAIDIAANTISVGANGQNTAYTGVISGGSGALTKVGAGTLTLSGANSYTGVTTISLGTLQLGTGITAQNGSVASTSIVNNAALTFNNADAQSYSGAISGTGTLTKIAAGTLTLSGANTHTGGTNVNVGTLALGSSGALGTTGTISFGGGTLQSSGSNTTDYSPRFSTAASQAYKLDTNNQNVTLATALTSSGGSLTKTGAGTLSISATPTYNGGTSINVGTLNFDALTINTNLAIDGGTPIAVGNVTVQSGATLDGNRSNYTGGTLTLNGGTWTESNGFGGSWTGPVALSATSTVSNNFNLAINGGVTGAGGLTKTGTGILTLKGAGTYAGTTTISAGTLQLGTGNVGENGTITGSIVDNATLTFNDGSDQTYAGEISGTGAVTKMGNGILELSGVNLYTGATTVSAGTLLVSGSISGSAVTVNGGTLGGTGGTTGAVTVNAGGTIAPGSSIGALNTGAMSLDTGATFALEINTTAATADFVSIAGNFSLAAAGGSVLTISDLNPAAFTSGMFAFINYSGTWDGDLFTYAGNVIADDTNLFVGGNEFTLDYNFGGDSVALLAVPEPNVAMALLGGLGMLLGLRRRRA